MFKKLVTSEVLEVLPENYSTSENSSLNKSTNTVKIYNSNRKIFFVESLKLTPVVGECRPHVSVQVLGKNFVALMDSGSSVSLLSSDIAAYLVSFGLKPQIDDVELRTADGTIHPATKYFDVPISFNGDIKVVKCLHVPSMSGKLLLGMNFWDKFDIVPVQKGRDALPCFSIFESSAPSVDFSPDHVISDEQSKMLEDVISIFPLSTDTKIGRTDFLKYNIDTGNSPPVVRRPYLYSPSVEKQIYEEIDRWLGMGVIRPSQSPWANPLVAVPKANSDKKRVCVDARFLNRITVKNRYPLPNINRLFARLPKSKFLSTIDLKDAFFQVPLDEESKKKTAFIVPGRGLFEFEVMCFGLCNAAQVQQELMDKVLGQKYEGRIFCYLDDIVVCSDSFEEHLEMLRYVAERLKLAGLTINVQKSKFCKREIKFLGNILSEDGL